MNCRTVHSRAKKRVVEEKREKEGERIHGSHARVESDSRNESGAKDRVDSTEQVAGDLERQGEERLGRGTREVDSDARAGTKGGCSQTLGCMRQVHTSSRPRAIQRLSTIQTRLSRSFVLSFPRFRSPSLLSFSLYSFILSLLFSFLDLRARVA